ncbi:MAG: type VI secretion system accessory protein TagJ [Pseudomonadota bacterium]
MAEDPRAAIKNGELDEALELAQAAARSAPADSKHRVLLFQLYAIFGDWNRSLRQLEIVSDLDPNAELMARTYRQLLACEAVRQDVFSGKRAPLGMGQPEAWFGMLIEALRLDGSAEPMAAKAMRDQAFEAADTTPGTLNGEPFDWIADGDERLGPCVEAIINGRYFWIPVERLKSVEVTAPEDLRDLVWLPTNLTFAHEGKTVAFIPARYPASEDSSDPLIRLARKTEWEESSAGGYRGVGQRMLATDLGETPIMEIREILLNSKPADG